MSATKEPTAAANPYDLILQRHKEAAQEEAAEDGDGGPLRAAPNPIVAGEPDRKTEDLLVKTVDSMATVQVKPRSYKEYLVSPIGAASHAAGLESRVVTNCVDESEAKQAYYKAFGKGNAPSRLPVSVKQVSVAQ